MFLMRSTGKSDMCSKGGTRGGKDRGAEVAREGESAAEAEGFLPVVLTLNWARSQWRQGWRVSFDM